MLSYRHGFHAGNFADVLKHATLALTIEALKKKDKGFMYLDTHAAAGHYDLSEPFAQKNREFDNGIGRLWGIAGPPAEIEPYLATVRELNPDGSLRYYPGSPRVASHLLRPQDRLVLCELHPTETENLRAEFARDRHVTVHQTDAYQALKAFLPPSERRGVVLIDPPFELKDEFNRFTEGLLDAYERWPTGIFLGWFPLHFRSAQQALYRKLQSSDIRKILRVEFSILPIAEQKSLYGCGMIIINPPWQLDVTLQRLLAWLWQKLSVDSAGGFTVEWLVPE